MMSAKQISEAEALGIAKGFVPNSKLKNTSEVKSMKLAYTNKEANDTYYYAFDKGDGEGYVLVSAEDGVDAILGYTDSGSFDYNNLPENMKWWLSSYVSQIKEAREIGAPTAPVVKSTGTSVAPLVTSKWNQGSPYNNLCPTITSGAHAATGCVATAMAQIMYYHKWPEKGTGTKSYSDNGSTRSADFGSTTYQWDTMTPTYSSSSTNDANNAVATLMYHCGVAAEMSYGASSGAMTNTAVYGMLQYFGYDEEARLLSRDYYGRTEWEQIMKSELDASRPIMYGGNSSSGGHQFVCDGYDANGLFHINWGWGGMSDGYFKIAILTPSQQGTGGSDGGFNYSQDAVIGLQRPNSVTNPIPYTLNNDGFSTFTTSTTKGSSVTFTVSKVLNGGYDSFTGKLGVGIYDSSTGALVNVICASTGSFTLKANYYTAFTVKGAIPTTLADGTYKLKLVSQTSGSTDWVLSPTIYTAGTNYMTVSGNNVSISQKDLVQSLTATNLVVGKALKNIMFEVKCDITNNGDEYYSTFNVQVLNKDTKKAVYTGSGIREDLLSGETLSLSFIEQITKLTAGSYLLTIVDDAGNQLCTPQDFELGDAPATAVLKINSLSFENANKVPKDNFVLTANIANTGGLFYDALYVVIFPKTGGTSLTYFNQIKQIDTTTGTDVVFDGQIDLDPGTYAVVIYKLNNGSLAQVTGNNWKTFTLVSPTGVISTIDDATETVTIYPNPAESVVNIKAGGEISAVRVFDMSGRLLINLPSTNQVDVSALSSGNYLMQIVVDGKAEMKPLIKK